MFGKYHPGPGRYLSTDPENQTVYISAHEYRAPKAGEWYVGAWNTADEHATRADADLPDDKFILAPTPSRTGPLAELNWKLDDHDLVILLRKAEEYAQNDRPSVGEYVRMADGSLRRFTHDWDDSLQTTLKDYGGSFYLYGRSVSFSGSLDPSIPRAGLRLTEERLPAEFWFFSHNDARAHNGVEVRIPVRVWQQGAPIKCKHCGRVIEEHKGTWWTGTDFQCPDGENSHAPA